MLNCGYMVQLCLPSTHTHHELHSWGLTPWFLSLLFQVDCLWSHSADSQAWDGGRQIHTRTCLEYFWTCFRMKLGEV